MSRSIRRRSSWRCITAAGITRPFITCSKVGSTWKISVAKLWKPSGRTFRSVKVLPDGFLENFSGETVEAIRQDFHAAVLLCNLETLLTQPAQEAIEQERRPEQDPKQINRADAYHALKDQLLPLLYSQSPAEEVVQKLQRLFLARPLSVPLDRKIPRRKQSFNRSYHFQRHVKKIVF